MAAAWRPRFCIDRRLRWENACGDQTEQVVDKGHAVQCYAAPSLWQVLYMRYKTDHAALRGRSREWS